MILGVVRVEFLEPVLPFSCGENATSAYKSLVIHGNTLQEKPINTCAVYKTSIYNANELNTYSSVLLFVSISRDITVT